MIASVVRGAVGALVLLSACGSPASSGRPPVSASQPMPVPRDDEARRVAIRDFGLELHAALRVARPSDLLFDDIALRELLEPEAATRAAALRQGVEARLRVDAAAFAALAETRFGGLCLQASRVEPASSVVGLRSRGWVVDRALLMALQPGGRRLGAWIEGTFLYTDAGFGAVDLSRVEAPRWEHSDLEILPCDMEVGIATPLPVVVATE